MKGSFRLYAAGLMLFLLAPLWAQPKGELPGRKSTGEVLLPNGWRIHPAGEQLEIDVGALGMALSPSGTRLAVLHCGVPAHSVMLIDALQRRILHQQPIAKGWVGVCWSPDGRRLYVSGGTDDVVRLFRVGVARLIEDGEVSVRAEGETTTQFVAQLAVSPDGRWLYAALMTGDGVAVIDLQERRMVRRLSVQGSPYGVAVSPDGALLAVSRWGMASVELFDTGTWQSLAQIPVGTHPNEMLFSADGKRLYVACANNNRVTVVDVAGRKAIEQVNVALSPRAPAGSTPNSLALSPDGKRLYVANADNNCIAVVDVSAGESRVLGFIPAGWYPAAVRVAPDHSTLYVLNSKGVTPLANPKQEYLPRILRGTVQFVPTPDEPTLRRHTARVRELMPYRDNLLTRAPSRLPKVIPAKVGDPSPIKYVVYIIKENRTYDQVFGDIPEGNGDPNLCLFGEEVTPNHHALAREFVLLDNFYVDAEVSADGHNWSTAAYATDYVEKTWPYGYGRHGHTYDYEGTNPLSRPDAGYIWDACKRAGVSYRSYGEFVYQDEDGSLKAAVPSLEGHFSPIFSPYNLDVPDMQRVQQFLTEFREYERRGDLPRFIILRLPNDHTWGTRPGKPTPRAMVAENDLALGTLVEALTQSRFWKEMAIFVLEDDSQNGPDHVDAHRSIALVISPYVKRRSVDSTLYTTCSMLRTMELILGLEPLSQYDAAATPMYRCFTDKPDFTPYKCLPARWNLDEKNPANAWGWQESLAMDLSQEDRVDDLLFSEIIWRSVKGADSPMPAPVRSIFSQTAFGNR
ncbi:MAG: beta-propeller fold lactonase family protein [Armatimonadota bacterium]|nr:beta-propeller fold lactonase family protein [Armatimonadota bacterium]